MFSNLLLVCEKHCFYHLMKSNYFILIERSFSEIPRPQYWQFCVTCWVTKTSQCWLLNHKRAVCMANLHLKLLTSLWKYFSFPYQPRVFTLMCYYKKKNSPKGRTTDHGLLCEQLDRGARLPRLKIVLLCHFISDMKSPCSFLCNKSLFTTFLVL